MPASGSSRPRSRCPSQDTPRSARPSSSAGRCSSRRSGSRPGWALFRYGSSGTTAGGSCSGGWRSRCRPSSPMETRRGSSTSSASSAPSLPIELYDNGVKTRLRLPAARRTRSPRLRPRPGTGWRSSGALASTASQVKGRAGRRGCSRLPSGVAEDPATGLGGGAAGAAPRAPRANRLRRRDRDLAGRRGRPAVDPLRAGRGLGRRRSARRGRRLRGNRRPRRAQRP